ncbi:3-octaprenyl-4-hydroxybenzoate carboxy-lyase [Saccharomonospora piscinae]|uniref:3-octaprenyl-4-hydroxybenzoate carboxy-lyase n=1 Tax=Saccharomonospora piscinae TaxID=687388 RepID=A0A1V9A5K8_SACPI|nr:suppressor of fused domain protein [Saccharomonospora piscinae]OQO92422.1 3-octaprenyl-4-hydroxybenzoate carboxy-lyase [Saccharomonospora piscinae]
MTESAVFPEHVFDALGARPIMHSDPIGGAVRMVEKQPDGGPITMLTLGASRLATDSGESVELAVEVVDGQQGAARVALAIVCDDLAMNRRVPPVGTPWRNSEPFLRGTEISAILVTPSRWGAKFDEVRSGKGDLMGHVRTLRLLTDAEAAFVASNGWERLCEKAGSVDALLDVTRESVVVSGGVPDNAPVFLTKLHGEHPPRWVTFTGANLQSVTGLESEQYMDDASNHEVWSTGSFLGRYPWVGGFIRAARPGQTALFSDDSGEYVIEDD